VAAGDNRNASGLPAAVAGKAWAQYAPWAVVRAVAFAPFSVSETDNRPRKTVADSSATAAAGARSRWYAPVQAFGFSKPLTCEDAAAPPAPAPAALPMVRCRCGAGMTGAAAASVQQLPAAAASTTAVGAASTRDEGVLAGVTALHLPPLPLPAGWPRSGAGASAYFSATVTLSVWLRTVPFANSSTASVGPQRPGCADPSALGSTSPLLCVSVTAGNLTVAGPRFQAVPEGGLGNGGSNAGTLAPQVQQLVSPATVLPLLQPSGWRHLVVQMEVLVAKVGEEPAPPCRAESDGTASCARAVRVGITAFVEGLKVWAADPRARTSKFGLAVGPHVRANGPSPSLQSLLGLPPEPAAGISLMSTGGSLDVQGLAVYVSYKPPAGARAPNDEGKSSDWGDAQPVPPAATLLLRSRQVAFMEAGQR
jgi:hypothetical protein